MPHNPIHDYYFYLCIFDNLYFHISLLNIQRVSNTKITYASLECVIQNDEIVYTCIMYRSCLLDSYHICQSMFNFGL